MRAFSAANLLEVWEQSSNQHAVDRNLTLLAAACPEMTRDELADLPVGRRDSYLVALREQTFGCALDSYAECPNCAERLEFTVATEEIRTSAETVAVECPLELIVEDFWLKARLPNSADLAAVAAYKDAETARRQLARRCVLEASQGGASVDVDELADQVIANLASHLADRDPQADVMIDLNCAVCGHQWQVIFDIGSFLWIEINALAKRLLHEVHTLARVYGWREADILAMSAARREFYLEMQG